MFVIFVFLLSCETYVPSAGVYQYYSRLKKSSIESISAHNVQCTKCDENMVGEQKVTIFRMCVFS